MSNALIILLRLFMISGDTRGGSDPGDQGVQVDLPRHHQGQGQGRHGHLLLGGEAGHQQQQRPQQRSHQRRKADAVVASMKRRRRRRRPQRRFLRHVSSLTQNFASSETANQKTLKSEDRHFVAVQKKTKFKSFQEKREKVNFFRVLSFFIFILLR